MVANKNDMNYCPYSMDQSDYYYKNKPEIFDDVSDEALPIIKGPLGKSQNWTIEQISKMTYKNAYSICDHIKAESYEGSGSYIFTN